VRAGSTAGAGSKRARRIGVYLRTSAGLGQATSKRKSYKPPFTKGGEAISEADGDKLLVILSGPSPYQDYILPVIAVQGSALPRKFLRIVTSLRQVPARLRRRFVRTGSTIVGGTIDRWTGTIYMIEAPGLRFRTRLEFALHEAVHLIGHPVIGRVNAGTFQTHYGTGLGEGATQVITEAIMDAQGITRYYRERPYEAFAPPVRELIRIFSLDAVARAYFWGDTGQFTSNGVTLGPSLEKRGGFHLQSSHENCSR
jgi:hypothetical protein